MIANLTRNWWTFGLRGLFAILIGLIAFTWPGVTLQALLFLFACFSMVSGILAVLAAIRIAGLGGKWGFLLFEGILSILAGIGTFAWPNVTALALLYVVAFYALLIGAMEIAAAFEFRKATDDAWLLGLTGVLSVVFSVLLLVWPASGLLSLVWLFGFYTIFYGVMLVSVSYRLNRANHTLKVFDQQPA